MKKITFLLLAMAMMLVYSCANGVKSDNVLLEENLADSAENWTIKDTVSRKFDFVYEDLKMPMKIKWVTAMDPAGCLRISTISLVKTQKESAFHFDDIQVSQLPCAMSAEGTSVETALLFGSFWAKIDGKEYSYDGCILNITGDGKYINMTKTP